MSARGTRHGSTITGTSWKRSARYCAESSTGASVAPRALLLDLLAIGRPSPCGSTRRASPASRCSVTTTKRHGSEFDAFGACCASARHSSSSSRSTGRSKSSRLRTARVVERSSSGVRSSSVSRHSVGRLAHELGQARADAAGERMLGREQRRLDARAEHRRAQHGVERGLERQLVVERQLAGDGQRGEAVHRRPASPGARARPPRARRRRLATSASIAALRQHGRAARQHQIAAVLGLRALRA